jgi:micrococcal nuclease
VHATVIRVVDGDTLHARVHGVDEKVRVIGMDSPESQKPNTPVECFAKQATAEAKKLLKPGNPITLQRDPTQDERDRFGRLLAHVFLADGSLFAETMIRHGWAVHYVYDGVPSIYADRLAAAEDAAKAEQAGLWSPTTCNGDPHLASARP